jgi:threonine synthase
MAKQFIQKYKGEYLTVSDDEILNASATLSRNTGIFAEPAAATSFAGLLKYHQENKLDKDSKNIVLLTGSGLKDLNSVQKLLNIPEAIQPTIDNLKKLI